MPSLRRSGTVRICRIAGVVMAHIYASPGMLTHALPAPAGDDCGALSIGLVGNQIAESVLGNIWPMVPSCTHISFNLAQPIGWSRQAMSLASRTRSGIAATRPRTENAITADRRIFRSFSA